MKKLMPIRILFLFVFLPIALILATGETVVQTAPTCNADDIFVGNFLSGTVVRFSKADIAVNGNASASTVIGSGLGFVEGITLDFDGTVIVTTRFSNTVYRFDRTGTPNCAIAKINSVEGPSFDAAGNLYVNDNTNPSITYKAAPVGGCPNVLSPVAWINTYPANTFTEDTRISPSTAPSFPSSLYILGSFGVFNNPNSIQAWSATTANTLLGTVIPDFGTAAGLGAGAYRSLGMAFDSQGDIWVADFSGGVAAGRLLEFNSAGVFQRVVTIPGSSRQLVKIAISAPNPTDPLNPNRNTIFVTEFGGRLYIVDEVTGTVLNTLTSNLNGSIGVAVCDVIVKPPPPVKAFITNFGSNTVSVIDTATNAVTATVPVGTQPSGVAVNEAGTRVYVANSGSNTVTVLDAASHAAIATVPVADQPSGVAVNGAGTRVYVARSGTNRVAAIDAATNAVTATVPVGFSPTGIAVNPAATRVYVANSGSNSVSVINTSSNTVVATVPVASTPVGVAVSPDGARVYVTRSAGNAVAVINASTNTVMATITVGNNPTGVAVNPAGTRAYVTDSGSNTVAVINTATNTVVATVPVGAFPSGVAINPGGTRVYVANSGSNTVAVIDAASNTVGGTVAVGNQPLAVGQFIGPR